MSDRTFDVSVSQCILCRVLWREPALAKYGDFRIFPTLGEGGNKGHKVRYQVVLAYHGIPVDERHEVAGISALFSFMTAEHPGEDFFILEPTHATVIDHWHRVACDIAPEGTDYTQINRTKRMRIVHSEPDKE